MDLVRVQASMFVIVLALVLAPVRETFVVVFAFKVLN